MENTEHLYWAEHGGIWGMREILQADEDFEAVIHPRPISGPLDVGQRFEFLRFHIDRHRNQVADLRTMLLA